MGLGYSDSPSPNTNFRPWFCIGVTSRLVLTNCSVLDARKWSRLVLDNESNCPIKWNFCLLSVKCNWDIWASRHHCLWHFSTVPLCPFLSFKSELGFWFNGISSVYVRQWNARFISLNWNCPNFAILCRYTWLVYHQIKSKRWSRFLHEWSLKEEDKTPHARHTTSLVSAGPAVCVCYDVLAWHLAPDWQMPSHVGCGKSWAPHVMLS